MKTITRMEIEATKLYNQLGRGIFFDTYHDLMFELVRQFDYLDDDIEGDYKIAEETLAKFKAIIKAQTILNNVNIE